MDQGPKNYKVKLLCSPTSILSFPINRDSKM